MKRLIIHWPAIYFGMLILTVAGCAPSTPTTSSVSASADPGDLSPVPVQVEFTEGSGWNLLRGGQPYSILGAGGEGSLELLAMSGGNSGRTWGVDGNTRRRLDEAHQHGLSMAVGIWLEHSQSGFDYSDTAAVETQFHKVIQAVESLKNHPAVLLWGLGNEMEGFESGDNPDLWRHVEALAAKIKQIDPNHPTMSVIAEVTEAKITAIHRHCPSLDIVGINSYGGCETVGQRYQKAGGTKPYVITEFGPIGTWEVPKNNIDAIIEPTSSEKAEMYRRSYQVMKQDTSLCLGGYAFLWGHKQEGTATWFGMLMPSGNKLSAVDTMTELWTGKPPPNPCPAIQPLEIDGPNDVSPNTTVRVRLNTSHPKGAKLHVVWTLMGEADSYITGGHFQEAPPSFDSAILKSDTSGATVQMPEQSGLYRLYADVDDGQGSSATANIPIRVTGEDMQFEQPTPLPYVLYENADEDDDFAPTGWMGATDQMKMNLRHEDRPFSGTYCIECQYQSASGWGGVVWQHPHEDWGDQPGGKNFSGASRLTFWARGREGGEKIKFGFGLLGREKKYWDTVKKEQEFVLSSDWQEYSIDLAGANLARIKTPFYWVVAAEGKPVVFYLDQIAVVP